MADQFDLEQGIMSCWHVTDDLNVLLEELVENDAFTKDQASNFVLGLSTIYQAKFEKLFRTFEEVLAEFYKKDRERCEALNEVDALHEDIEALHEEARLTEEANMILAGASEQPEMVSLDELFRQQEEAELDLLMDENDQLAGFEIEDEFGFR
jgi:hypothetical protein